MGEDEEQRRGKQRRVYGHQRFSWDINFQLGRPTSKNLRQKNHTKSPPQNPPLNMTSIQWLWGIIPSHDTGGGQKKKSITDQPTPINSTGQVLWERSVPSTGYRHRPTTFLSLCSTLYGWYFFRSYLTSISCTVVLTRRAPARWLPGGDLYPGPVCLPSPPISTDITHDISPLAAN